MRTLPFKFVCAAALALLSLCAFAQDFPPAKDMVLGKKLFIAFGKKVRDELKITDAQFKKMEAAFEGTLQVEGDRVMVTVSGGEDLGAMEKQAMKVLDEEQKKRLNECWIQMMGALAVADEGVGQAVRLTKEQSKSVDAIIEETAKQIHDLFMSGHDESTPKQLRALRAKGSEKVLALLDDEQKANFEKLKGKPFKWEPEKSGG